MASRTAGAANSSDMVIVRFHQTERPKMFHLLPIGKAPWQANQYGRLRSMSLSNERLPDFATMAESTEINFLVAALRENTA